MEKQIDIDDLKIVYEETGKKDGNPVIILHGWGCNHTTVQSIGSCLDDKMRVIALDLPGHGKSEEPKEVWNTYDFAAFLGKFLNHLNIKDPSLIGHSFGGRTSIYYAANNKVNKIVLVDSAGIKPKRSLKYYYKVYSYKLYKKIILTFLGEEKGKNIIERSLQKKASADYKAASPKMRAIMSRCVNEDLKDLMPSVKAPTLLIWGEEDSATPIADAKIMEKLIPDAGLVTFPGCGHYSFLDNPLSFKAVIREFFKPELSSSSNSKP